MTREEISRLLVLISAIDNRRPADEITEAMWFAIFEGETFTATDAEQAVVAHYRSSTEWLMPAHVVEEAREICTDREHKARQWTAQREEMQRLSNWLVPLGITMQEWSERQDDSAWIADVYRRSAALGALPKVDCQ